MRIASTGLLVIIVLLALAGPARAGGWATIRLDEPLGDVLVGVPLTIGFMVRQHDVTPTSDVEPVLRATSVETAEVISVTARQDGAIGHFVAEVTFPAAGEWKWVIQPEPFGETSFETLTVLDKLPDLGFSASIITNS